MTTEQQAARVREENLQCDLDVVKRECVYWQQRTTKLETLLREVRDSVPEFEDAMGACLGGCRGAVGLPIWEWKHEPDCLWTRIDAALKGTDQ